MTVIIHGWDLSLNHAGIVELRDGVMSNFWFIHNKRSVAKSVGENGIYLEYETSDDSRVTAINRLVAWDNLLPTFLSKPVDFLGIEDYALGMARHSHDIGEVGGLFRLHARKKALYFRLLDPLSVKMYTAENGLAKKDMMERAVKEKYGQDFSHLRKEPKEDLVDAYAIAQMVWMEYRLRAGQVQLSSLSEKEIRVFNRTSKMYPVNILGRDWVR